MALLSTQPITWGTTLAFAILVPAYLGDRALGQYTLAVTIAGLLGTLLALGVPDYLVRRVATAPTRANVEGMGALALLLGSAVPVGALVSVALYLAGLPVARSLLLPIALASMVFVRAQTLLLALLRGQERHARFAWLNAGSTVLAALAGLGALALGADVTGFMAASTATLALIALTGWRTSGFAPTREALDLGLMRRLVVGGLPFLGWSLALRVYSDVDRVILAVLSTEAAIGWYAAAYRIVAIPGFVPMLIMTPLFPVLSRLVNDLSEFGRTLRRSVEIVFALTVPIAAMTIAVAPALPATLAWPAGFVHSVPLVMILALQAPLASVDMLLGSALFALGRERRWLGVAVLAAIVNPILNLLLIPPFERALQNGAIGAAIATVLTEVLMFGGALVLLPRGVLMKANLLVAVRVLLAGLALWAVAARLLPLSLAAALAAGSAAYVAAAAALGVVGVAELRSAGRLARQALLERSAR